MNITPRRAAQSSTSLLCLLESTGGFDLTLEKNRNKPSRCHLHISAPQKVHFRVCQVCKDGRTALYVHLFHSCSPNSTMCKGLCWQRIAGKTLGEAAKSHEKFLRLQGARQVGENERQPSWLKGREPRRVSLEKGVGGTKGGRSW